MVRIQRGGDQIGGSDIPGALSSSASFARDAGRSAFDAERRSVYF
jgi:hypothetical protein